MGAILGLLASLGVLLVGAAIASPRARRSRRNIGALDRLIARAGIARLTVSNVIGACVGTGLVIGVLALVTTAVPVMAVLASVVGAVIPVVLLRRRAHQREKALRACWPDAVDTLASGVRAGMSLPEAVAELSRRGPEPLRASFTVFAAEYRASGSFAAALDTLQGHVADPVADRVIAALRIAREVGGTDLGVVLRTLSALLREDARTRGDIEARQSWTVNAARVAVAAPWVTLVMLSTRPETVTAYRSATGALVLVAALAMSIAAYRVMMAIGRLPIEQRIVR